jgi:hypothetical protein
MLTNILSKIICDTYEKEFRHKQEVGKYLAMKITFDMPIDYNTEEGYRWIELLLIWEGYVGVFVREHWNIMPIKGIDYKNDCLKKGFDYIEGNTEWKILSCHDSCWRGDGVERFVFNNRDKFLGIKTFFKWYERIELTEEENNKFRMIERGR